MSETCPKCGCGIMGTSEEPTGIHYLCGTWFIDGKLRERTVACYKTQISQQEKRLEAWRDFWKAVKPWLYLEGVKNPLIPFIHRLKSMGEI